jgi:hypothetical protein
LAKADESHHCVDYIGAMCSATRYKGGLKRKRLGKLSAQAYLAHGVNRDVSLWLWFKRRILTDGSRLAAMEKADSAEDLTSVCDAIEFNLLADLPRSVVDRAVNRYKDGYQTFLLDNVFDLVADVKKMTETGIGTVVDSACGLSLIALRDLKVKKGQRLSAIQGLACAVRAADSDDSKICNSFIAPSSGSASGTEKFLGGLLSLAAHCCEPRLQLVPVKGAPTTTYTLAAKSSHTIAKGALISFRYCDPAKLGFECRCPAEHSTTTLEVSGASGKKRKLQAEAREGRANKRRKGEGGQDVDV